MLAILGRLVQEQLIASIGQTQQMMAGARAAHVGRAHRREVAHNGLQMEELLASEGGSGRGGRCDGG